MERIIHLNINDENFEVIARPRESLLDVLRNKLKLTGTKIGCNEGDCGACTVIMDGRTVNACLVLAVEAEGDQRALIVGHLEAHDASRGRKAVVHVGERIGLGPAILAQRGTRISAGTCWGRTI